MHLYSHRYAGVNKCEPFNQLPLVNCYSCLRAASRDLIHMKTGHKCPRQFREWPLETGSKFESFVMDSLHFKKTPEEINIFRGRDKKVVLISTLENNFTDMNF